MSLVTDEQNKAKKGDMDSRTRKFMAEIGRKGGMAKKGKKVTYKISPEELKEIRRKGALKAAESKRRKRDELLKEKNQLKNKDEEQE